VILTHREVFALAVLFAALGVGAWLAKSGRELLNSREGRELPARRQASPRRAAEAGARRNRQAPPRTIPTRFVGLDAMAPTLQNPDDLYRDRARRRERQTAILVPYWGPPSRTARGRPRHTLGASA
jgi:hypothetical protein